MPTLPTPTPILPITLLGDLPPGLWVHWMNGREEMGRLYEYELEIFSEAVDLGLATLLGKAVTVCLSQQEGVRRWNGIVTRLRRMRDADGVMVFRAVLSPRLWLLTRTRDCRIYQGLTVPEVVKSVFREHAIVFSERLQPGYRTWDYLTQYRESDFDFVSRIMEQEGIYYYFRHALDRHELVLADSVASHDPSPGYERLPVRPEGTAKVARDHLHDWRPVHRAGSARVALQDHDFRLRRGADLRVARSAGPEHTEDAYEIYDYPGEHVTAENREQGDAGAHREAGEHYALTRLDEARVGLDQVEAEGNARGVQTGALLQIDVPAVAARKYLVTGTEHRLRNIDFRSGGSDKQELCQVSLTGIDSQRPFRPARLTPRPVIAGPQTAVVVGQAGEEIWTDKHGRVKVQFPWDREGKSDEQSSCWVRVAQVWAGQGWGGIHIPRLGQEVVVQFLEGDPNRPLVTGSLYNADNPPPYPLPAGATQSGIKTRSTKGGSADNFNEIRLEDRKGAEEMHLQAERDMSTLVKHDQSTTVQNDQTVAVQANRSLSVGGNESHAVTGTRSLSVTGDDTQSFSANRQISVTGTDSHAITGARTETYQGGRSRSVTGADSTTVEGGNKETTVHGEYNITADAKYLVQQAGNQLLISTLVMLEGMADVTITNPGSTISMSGGAVNIFAGKEINLTCGSAQISLTSDGTISITGAQKVNASSGNSAVELVPSSATLTSKNSTVVQGKTVTEISGGTVKIN
jgi:type VI secretion system secreted protein VgrG